MNSDICLFGSVSAMRLGIMNGVLDDGLASANSSWPVGSFNLITMVLASGADIESTKVENTFCPSVSFADQRLIEVMQSSAVTGCPSCHSSPSRNVSV